MNSAPLTTRESWRKRDDPCIRRLKRLVKRRQDPARHHGGDSPESQKSVLHIGADHCDAASWRFTPVRRLHPLSAVPDGYVISDAGSNPKKDALPVERPDLHSVQAQNHQRVRKRCVCRLQPRCKPVAERHDLKTKHVKSDTGKSIYQSAFAPTLMKKRRCISCRPENVAPTCGARTPRSGRQTKTPSARPVPSRLCRRPSRARSRFVCPPA